MVESFQSLDHTQVKFGKMCPSYPGTRYIGSLEGSSVKDSPAQISCTQVRPVEDGPAQISCTQVRPVKDSPAQISCTQVRPTQVSCPKVSAPEISFTEIGSAKMGPTEIGSAKTSPSKVGAAEIGSVEVDASEAGRIEAWPDLRMLRSPFVPVIHTLTKHLEIFFLIQLVSLPPLAVVPPLYSGCVRRVNVAN